MRPATRSRWLIHGCVVLWGFTAILGKLISLPAASLVWWRMVLVAALLLPLPGLWRNLAALSRRQVGIYAGIGCIVTLHWVTFYGAIKLANASVAASCLALCPVFLAVLEPWIARQPHRLTELWLGVVAIPGVLLVVGGTPDAMNAGIAVGVLSAFFVAIFAALNKRHIGTTDALTVTWIEMAAGAALLTLLLPFTGSSDPFGLPDARDAMWLLVLAVACTLLPFALSLAAIRHLSAFEAQLAVNLEPVYTIVLAMLVFGEQRELTAGFYAGVALIIGAVLLHPVLARPR